LYISLALCFVTGESKLYTLELLFLLSLGFSSITLWIFIFRETHPSLIKPKKVIPVIYRYRQEFWLRLISVSYMQANGPIISLFAGNHSAGVYIALERFARSVINSLTPIIQSSFPEISRLVKINLELAKEKVFKTAVKMLSGMFLLQFS